MAGSVYCAYDLTAGSASNDFSGVANRLKRVGVETTHIPAWMFDSPEPDRIIAEVDYLLIDGGISPARVRPILHGAALQGIPRMLYLADQNHARQWVGAFKALEGERASHAFNVVAMTRASATKLAGEAIDPWPPTPGVSSSIGRLCNAWMMAIEDAPRGCWQLITPGGKSRRMPLSRRGNSGDVLDRAATSMILQRVVRGNWNIEPMIELSLAL